MKKSILALAAMALLMSNTQAQDSVKPVRLGLTVSPNMGWITTDEDGIENDGTRTGFRFGLMGDFRMGSDNYFFSSGLMMNTIGAKIKTGEDTSAVSAEVKYQMVEIPITVKLKTAEIGYMTYFGQIGFDTGFRVAAKTKVDDDWEDASEEANILRAALSVGGGLEYNFSGNTSAILGVRYSNGFTSINDGDGAEAKLHYFEITLGALF